MSISDHPFDHLVTFGKGCREAVTILVTMGLVLLLFLGVGVVLARVEWGPARRDASALEARLTSALLATRDDEPRRSVPMTAGARADGEASVIAAPR